MTSTTLTSIKNHSLRLALFALVTASVLSTVRYLTGARIAEQQSLAEQAVLEAILPSIIHDNNLLGDSFYLQPDSPLYEQSSLLALSEPRKAYRASMQNQAVGLILPVESHSAYNGDMLLYVGINTEGKITGVRVLEHSETPGLGDKIEPRISDWIYAFNNRSLGSPPEALWQVKKDGGDFDQFTGATITPRATVTAVKNALLFYEQNSDRLFTVQSSDSK